MIFLRGKNPEKSTKDLFFKEWLNLVASEIITSSTGLIYLTKLPVQMKLQKDSPWIKNNWIMKMTTHWIKFLILMKIVS